MQTARRQRSGVNLERPEAEPRTNEIDAGEVRRTLGQLDKPLALFRGVYRQQAPPC